MELELGGRIAFGVEMRMNQSLSHGKRTLPPNLTLSSSSDLLVLPSTPEPTCILAGLRDSQSMAFGKDGLDAVILRLPNAATP